MKIVAVSFILLFALSPAFAQKVDTTYYDKDWEPLKSKTGAVFIGTKQAVNDSTIAIKDYYLTGQLQNSGFYINGVKKGRWTYYYPDGKVKIDFEYIENGKNKNYFVFDEESLKPNEEGIYHTVNNLAKFQGEPEGAQNYINSNFKLPKEAKKNGFTSFNIFCKLIIDEKGKVVHAEEMRRYAVKTGVAKYETREGPSKLKFGTEEALTKFLLAMPAWQPATVMGKPVKTVHILKVVYAAK